MIKKKKFYFIVFCSLLIMTLLSFYVSAQSLCQYASSATATSENFGSLANYATGPSDANGNCAVWSGTQKSWNPINWDVKANLTLNYDTPVYISNLTIFGDYDICWSSMWLKNSVTGNEKQIFNGFENSCTSTQTLDGSFQADSIILETCGWSWSSTDAVEMCGISSV